LSISVPINLIADNLKRSRVVFANDLVHLLVGVGAGRLYPRSNQKFDEQIIKTDY